jgi:DNA-binding NtrC family response regulator
MTSFPNDLTRQTAESTLPSLATARLSVPRLAVRVVPPGTGTPATDHLVEGEKLRIGSHPSNDLVLGDRHVSRFHCTLTRSANRWRVQDNGSLNGTRLGGVMIRDADLSLPESTLQLGESTLVLRAVESIHESVVSLSQNFGTIVGATSPMQRLFDLLRRIAPSSADILIEGESGTGKELVASEIVAHSPRSEGPLVVVDCGAISPHLIESELFGHAKGAFTGATRDRAGAFESADGGTIFLDEIGELPLEMQPKLLRVLAQREVRRVGCERVRPIDVRVVAATNRSLEREVNAGRFREDLYYRLSVVTLNVPPLRERIDDLALLVDLFLTQLGAMDQRDTLEAQLPVMRRYAWPGNVRELRNFVERTVVLGPDTGPLERRAGMPANAPGIESKHFDGSLPFGEAKRAVLQDFERRYLTALIKLANGNVSQASRMAKLDRMHLHKLLQHYELRTRPGDEA